MTTEVASSAMCAVCGMSCEQAPAASSNCFGTSDLDTRPPEMMRSTIVGWVKECPGCGYCAEDLTTATPEIAETVRRPEYQAQLHDAAYPRLANRYVCWSWILRESHCILPSAWQLLHAAWVCDDEGERESARTLRREAIAAFERSLLEDPRRSPQTGAEDALLVDMQRRSGQFPEAAVRARIALSRNDLESVVREILLFQLKLIQNTNEAEYTLSDVFPY